MEFISQSLMTAVTLLLAWSDYPSARKDSLANARCALSILNTLLEQAVEPMVHYEMHMMVLSS